MSIGVDRWKTEILSIKASLNKQIKLTLWSLQADRYRTMYSVNNYKS